MAKTSGGPEQAELIPLTADELEAAQRELPQLIGELEDLEEEHAEERKAQKKERTALRDRISSLSRQVREQGR